MTRKERRWQLTNAWTSLTTEDPRDARFATHLLGDILTVALCATLSGARSFEDIAAFGRSRRDWLSSLGLALPHGIPSHDTFRDVFRHLAPDIFQGCFTAWINAACARLGLGNVQVDGKALRGSRGPGGTCLHIVSAWAGANALTLGQVAVEDKSNEVTAIPRLLRLLELQGALVSIDAIGCQKDVASAIRDSGADYLLQVKGNQPTLEADIIATFEAAVAADFEGFEHDLWLCESRGHGREEERACAVLYDLSRLRGRDDWVDLRAIVRVARTRWGGQGDVRGGPLHQQSPRQCRGVGQRHPGPLGHRERPALGAGRDLPGEPLPQGYNTLPGRGE